MGALGWGGGQGLLSSSSFISLARQSPHECETDPPHSNQGAQGEERTVLGECGISSNPRTALTRLK